MHLACSGLGAALFLLFSGCGASAVCHCPPGCGREMNLTTPQWQRLQRRRRVPVRYWTPIVLQDGVVVEIYKRLRASVAEMCMSRASESWTSACLLFSLQLRGTIKHI